MLKHLQEYSTGRVVIVGAGGFVGKTLLEHLKQYNRPVLALGSATLNLLEEGAGDTLLSLLHSDDIVVMISSKVPCNTAELVDHNIAMMHAVRGALIKKAVKHVIYISSDAVYADSEAPLTEQSMTAPNTIHGAMHIVREKVMEYVCSLHDTPLAILRSSILYGAQDTHNRYGPNQFRRLAHNHQPIMLFGEGEEQRDHVYIQDVAEIIARVIQRRSYGVLNIASGRVMSFKEIAEKVVEISGNKVMIHGRPRSHPVMYSQARAFDVTACQAAFPDFSYTSMSDGLKYAQAGAVKEMDDVTN